MKGTAIAVAALGLSMALLSGCKKDIQSNDAVKQGIMTYLAKRPDLVAMDVSVTSVTYRQDEATATVRFQAKGNNSQSASMTMQYVLERKGNEWAVKGRSGADSHGAAGQPQNAPDSGSIGAMPQTMPPGHPPVSSDKKPGQPK